MEELLLGVSAVPLGNALSNRTAAPFPSTLAPPPSALNSGTAAAGATRSSGVSPFGANLQPVVNRKPISFGSSTFGGGKVEPDEDIPVPVATLHSAAPSHNAAFSSFPAVSPGAVAPVTFPTVSPPAAAAAPEAPQKRVPQSANASGSSEKLNAAISYPQSGTGKQSGTSAVPSTKESSHTVTSTLVQTTHDAPLQMPILTGIDDRPVSAQAVHNQKVLQGITDALKLSRASEQLLAWSHIIHQRNETLAVLNGILKAEEDRVAQTSASIQQLRASHAPLLRQRSVSKGSAAAAQERMWRQYEPALRQAYRHHWKRLEGLVKQLDDATIRRGDVRVDTVE